MRVKYSRSRYTSTLLDLLVEEVSKSAVGHKGDLLMHFDYHGVDVRY